MRPLGGVSKKPRLHYTPWQNLAVLALIGRYVEEDGVCITEASRTSKKFALKHRQVDEG